MQPRAHSFAQPCSLNFGIRKSVSLSDKSQILARRGGGDKTGLNADVLCLFVSGFPLFKQGCLIKTLTDKI